MSNCVPNCQLLYSPLPKPRGISLHLVNAEAHGALWNISTIRLAFPQMEHYKRGVLIQ
jgi:hypothetical protein